VWYWQIQGILVLDPLAESYGFEGNGKAELPLRPHSKGLLAFILLFKQNKRAVTKP